jgi:hypothetical protein
MSFVRVRNKGILWVPKPILDSALAKKAEQDKQTAEQSAKENS